MLGVISLGVVALGVVALVSWLRHDPKAAAAARARPVDDVAPDSAEAAVKVAREFCELMLERKFAEAALITTGAAAQLAQQELKMQLSKDASRDPELIRILDEGLRGSLLSFKAENVQVLEKGSAVSLRARMRVRIGGNDSDLAPRIQVRWTFDRWRVADMRPDDAAAGRTRL